MNLPEKIRTVDVYNQSTFTEKKSNFIAQVYPITTEDQTKSFLAETKKKYYDASHHCYAIKLADGSFRYSDAGEPSGTAGIRILNAIDHFKLSNLIVIVTRYFGGTKLGVGLLGKSYYAAAYEVLSNSFITKKQLFQKVIISSEFDQISIVRRVLNNHQSIILKDEYMANVKFHCLIKYGELESTFKNLAEMGKNKIIIDDLNEFIYK